MMFAICIHTTRENDFDPELQTQTQTLDFRLQKNTVLWADINLDARWTQACNPKHFFKN